ncbi:MAG: WbqC family protein [Candidatus Azobacteroides sp.]|nr:WbqC family protein [Candidatus Azobacteroides sp.]
MSTCCLTTSYLAPVQYYCKLYSFDHVIIERHCNYIKQTYRNRCVIAAANGLMVLSLPIEKRDDPKQPTKDVRLSEHGNWRHLHWNAIVSAYNSTPFFEYYRDDFYPFFEKKIPFLFDFNEGLRALICELLSIESRVTFSECYQIDFSDEVADYRELIHPKKKISSDVHFSPAPYYQVFESRYGFQANLSIIDLLFNMGPESGIVLRDSIR